MILSAQGTSMGIDDVYVEYSPFLSMMKSTSLQVEMENGAYVIDVEPYVLSEYIQFLQGLDFFMDANVAMFFDYMGHHNQMNYPLDYWMIKLKDNWIRDSFYKLKLCEDPYYRLVEIPVERHLRLYRYSKDGETFDADAGDRISDYGTECKPIKLGGPVYVAGGAALWVGGYIDTVEDVDLFVVADEGTANKYTSSYTMYHCDNVSNIGGEIESLNGPSTLEYKKIQLIHRLYKSPAQIIYGFDLDCVGVLYDGKSLWATERALYSLREKMNWFDPSRASPSYIYRLAKYKSRGFDIGLPLFSDSNLNRDAIGDFASKIIGTILDHPNLEEHVGDLDNEEFFSTLKPYMTHLSEEDIDRLYKLASFRLQNKSALGYMMHLVWGDLDDLPADPASQLILAKYYNVVSSRWKKTDYDVIVRIRDMYGTINKRFNVSDGDIVPSNGIVWITQDPMTQITGTFNPQPISDMEKFYSASSFYTPSM